MLDQREKSKEDQSTIEEEDITKEESTMEEDTIEEEELCKLLNLIHSQVLSQSQPLRLSQSQDHLLQDADHTQDRPLQDADHTLTHIHTQDLILTESATGNGPLDTSLEEWTTSREKPSSSS